MASSFLKFLEHNDEQQSVGLLWMRDQLVAEASTGQYRTLTTNIHVPSGIRTTIAAGERLQTFVLGRATTGTG
jgi:hypothetical protein